MFRVFLALAVLVLLSSVASADSSRTSCVRLQPNDNNGTFDFWENSCSEKVEVKWFSSGCPNG